jgi:hypothetical protein
MAKRMLIDVEDGARNYLLNACFYSVSILTLLALVPWRSFGAERMSRLLRWLVFPVLALAIVYEAAMPVRYNIRVDLLLLLPAYAVVLVTSVARWRASRAA